MKIVKKISEEGQKLKDEITLMDSKIRELHKQKISCSCSCKHELIELSQEKFKDEWMSVGAICLICGDYFGWRCKNSPDSVCHYYSENGKVELIDGTLVDVPKGHDAEYETDDSCIFCGEPEERK